MRISRPRNSSCPHFTYGEFWQITPEAKATIDRLIDRAAERHIALLAWTVPREPSAEDIAANGAALAHRTPAGNGMRGLAVDLERGEEFLGRGRPGYAALARYLGFVRSAVGARALIIATVEDPYLDWKSWIIVRFPIARSRRAPMSSNR